MAYTKKKDKKYSVIWGIPMYPEYLDCQVKGDSAYDRYGNWLSYEKRTKIYQEKQKAREDWRDSNPNIKNRKTKEKEDV
jgi:hypothetical protein